MSGSSDTSADTPRTRPSGATWAAVAVFGVAGTIAVVLGHFGGYVSPDSSNYLQLAGQISGTGNFEHSALWASGPPAFMTVWPVGYPVVVSAFASLGLHVLAASKVVAVLLLGGSLLVVSRIFCANTRWLALTVFLLPSSVRIHTYSWSEQLFIFGCLLSLFFAKKLRSDSRWWPALAAAMSLVFCARYIGAFLPLTVLGAALVWRGMPQRRWFFAAGLVAATADTLYLANNFAVAGHLTGTERIPAPESLTTLAVGFARSVALDAGPYVVLVGAVAYAAWRGGVAWLRTQLERHPDAVGCVVIGAAYLAALFILRSHRHFDFFNSRLTFPGVALVLVGLVHLVPFRAHAADRWVNRATACATVLYLCAWTCSHASGLDTSTSALEKASRVATRYATLPTGTILVDPDAKHGYLEYPQRLVRPDLILVEPRAAPYFDPESAADFAARLSSVALARPGARCVLDFTGADDLPGYRAGLERRGVSAGVVTWLSQRAQPGQLVELPGCGGPAPDSLADAPAPRLRAPAPRLRRALRSRDAAGRVHRSDSQVARAAHR